ncbi:hypothetical protein [Actinomadura vinacea]
MDAALVWKGVIGMESMVANEGLATTSMYGFSRFRTMADLDS